MDEKPLVRQNASAFWTHAVCPEGARITARRIESIPRSPPANEHVSETICKLRANKHRFALLVGRIPSDPQPIPYVK
jgi:hypothetical protein